MTSGPHDPRLALAAWGQHPPPRFGAGGTFRNLLLDQVGATYGPGSPLPCWTRVFIAWISLGTADTALKVTL